LHPAWHDLQTLPTLNVNIGSCEKIMKNLHGSSGRQYLRTTAQHGQKQIWLGTTYQRYRYWHPLQANDQGNSTHMRVHWIAVNPVNRFK
jgi:hypothetical protein